VWRIFGHNREAVTEEWRKLHDFYYSQNIIKAIKSRIRWARYVALTEEVKNVYSFLVGNLEGRDLLEDLGADGTIIWQ
jgi:hypothetical protein